jgi:(E)-benzylidenesuccinyl-CoA hydratase
MAIRHGIRDGVATVTLDRPEKLNALDPAHLRALRDILSQLSSDPSVRVIILTGSGQKSFCVGADLSASGGSDAGVAEGFGFDLEQSSERGLYIRLLDLSGLQLRKPLIAAVNGYCLGGGLELALQCDLIIASQNATFGLPEVAVASLPGANGVAALVRAIPRAVAMRIVLSGERIDASRAHAVGLVSDLFPLDLLLDEATALARRLAENGPLAVQLVKMLAGHAADLTQAQSFQMTELAWGLLRDTADRQEGRQAFVEKRKPRYFGR